MSAWDGYYNDCNNYRLYHDPASGRMVMMPHGLDNMFQVDDAHWRPELHSLLGKALLHTSEGQDLYRERFWRAFDGPLQAGLVIPRVDAIATRQRIGCVDTQGNVPPTRRGRPGRMADVERVG